MALTDTAIRAAKPKDAPYKLSDGGGLFLAVNPTGSRLWRLKYRLAGKEKLLAIGAYPVVSLAQARKQRDDAKELLSRGGDPSQAKQDAKRASEESAGNTFKVIAQEYVSKLRREGRAAATLTKTEWLLDLVYGHIGDKPIRDITASQVLDALRSIERRGRHETARRARSTVGTVFRYAIATTPLYLDASAKTDEGTLMPSTQVEMMGKENGRARVRIDGWQQDGVSEVFYAAPGKRILSVLVGDAAKKALVTGKSETDSATNLTWHQVSLTAWVDESQLIGDQGKLWQYASTLMSNNCTGCHGLTALDHFNANQWIGVIKGMESRTSLTPEQARMLTQYVQKHASDMSAAH